jgi:aminoglycoside/choline kinase family phosphotransferase
LLKSHTFPSPAIATTVTEAPAGDARLDALRDWLAQRLDGAPFGLAPASADASFRRYFRVSLPGRTLIAMDAPPPREDCRPFVRIARLLREAGVNAPEVIAEDLGVGFLLLADLGSTTYLDALDASSAGGLYDAALESLLRWQLASRPGVLPPYDRALLRHELELFPDWYLQRHLEAALAPPEREALERAFDVVLANNIGQPAVYVHRDYHSRNLMVCEPCPGVLDFQDAVHGPVTYDLVSLLRDAYVEWPEERELDWVIRYWERARRAGLPVTGDFAEFHRDYEWMGVQRQLKVLGIFARLFHRDGKARYLADMPRVSGYLRRTCSRYRELAGLLRLLDRVESRLPQPGYSF